MKRTMQIQITVTRVYDVEFDDTLSASRMFKELERDPNPTTIESQSDSSADGTWSIRARRDAKRVSVEPVPPEFVP